MGSGDCVKCMSKIPYATLIATIMCCVGVGVFCVTMYRGVMLTLHLTKTIFSYEYKWLGDLSIFFIIIASVMGAVALLILFVGFLATGSTRERIYKGWKARVGGRVSCVLFMLVTYLLNLAWLLILCVLVVLTMTFAIFWNACSNKVDGCINLELFEFLYPNGTKVEKMKLCETQDIRAFCRDYVEPAEIMYILATVASFLVVISLVHYLMCLVSNYTHIKENEKYVDLQELQYLHDSELSGLPKERF